MEGVSPPQERRKRPTLKLDLRATQELIEEKKKAESEHRVYTFDVPLPGNPEIIIDIEKPSRDVWAFLLFFASIQVVDGVLTMIGVNRYGIGAEGNPLLRSMMLNFSPEQTLVITKTAAVFLIVLITIIIKRSRQFKHVVSVLSGIYIFAAILPWTFLLLVH